MATPKQNTTKDIIESLKILWPVLVSIAGILSVVFYTGYKCGSYFEEIKSNLDKTEAIQACNERVNAEKTINADLKNEINKKISEDILKVVASLKPNNGQ